MFRNNRFDVLNLMPLPPLLVKVLAPPLRVLLQRQFQLVLA